MNALQQDRFARLQFPVHQVDAKNPEEFFELLPGLRRYFQKLRWGKVKVTNAFGGEPEMVDGIEANYRGVFENDIIKVVKYIVFMYDPDSDLLAEYPEDTRLRKEAAAKEAGFKRNQVGEWPPYIEDIFNLKEKQVTLWIVEYLKVKKNHIWTEIKYIEEEIELLQRQRMDAMIQGKVEPTMMKLIKDRLEERESLYKRFYAEHLDLKKATQDEIYPVSPENVFKEMKIPDEVWRVKQVKDVPKHAGVN